MKYWAVYEKIGNRLIWVGRTDDSRTEYLIDYNNSSGTLRKTDNDAWVSFSDGFLEREEWTELTREEYEELAFVESI